MAKLAAMANSRLFGLLLLVAALCRSGLSFTAPLATPLTRKATPCASALHCAPLPAATPQGRTASIGGSALLFSLMTVGAAGAALARRRSRSACEAVGLFYATQTGNTENAAGLIASEAGVEAADIGDYGAEDLAGYDGLIVGCPTWNTGADEYRSGTSWDDLLDDIKGVDLKGKPVAVFGCGDAGAYGDNFCDGIEELHDTFKAAGAKLVGYVDSSGYEHSESKSDQGGKFLGCPFDEDNQSDMSEDRAKAWVAQIKSEGMPL
jgi:flavodoxin I